MALGVLIAEDFDAQQPDDGSNPVTILLQFFIRWITLHFQVHFDALNKLVEKPERQVILMDNGLKFLKNGQTWRTACAGQVDLRSPGSQLAAAFRCRNGILIGNIVHRSAKRIESGHAKALRFGQQHESERQVRGAFPSDRLAELSSCHRLTSSRFSQISPETSTECFRPSRAPLGLPDQEEPDFSSGRSGGSPPVSAKVGLRARCLRRFQRYL